MNPRLLWASQLAKVLLVIGILFQSIQNRCCVPLSLSRVPQQVQKEQQQDNPSYALARKNNYPTGFL